MADLLLIRHAEPERSGVFLGQLDLPLSARGRDEAAKLQLEPRFKSLYCSPLRRAQETAAAIGRPLETMAGLAEIHYGPWEGLSWQEIEARFPDQARRKMDDWLGYTVPGAEPWEDLRARVRAALESILLRREDCVVVAHLAVNSVMHEYFCDESPIQFRQDYCQILSYPL